MKKVYFSFLIFFFFFQSKAQQKHYQLQWNFSSLKNKEILRPDQVILFDDKYYQYSSDNLYFFDHWESSQPVNSDQIRLVNIKKSLISQDIVNQLKISEIPEDFKIKMASSFARNKLLTSLQVNAIIKKNGLYYKLDAFDVLYTFKNPENNFNKATQNIYDSRWSSGDWYRFKISKSGVYKLDKNFIKSLGIDVNNLDPRKLKIFGNGAKLMPLGNNKFFPEDIQEVAIEFVGEQDGVFNDDDYVLFYAQGPEWSLENDTNLNIYTDDFYYFIQIDQNNGKRITAYQEPSGTVVHSFTDYSAYKFYEKDETNFSNMGRKFYEKALTSQSKTISFNFENLVTSKPIYYRISAASNFGSSTSYAAKLNGNFLGSGTFSVNTYTVGDEVVIEGDTMVNDNSLDFTITHNNGGNFDAKLYLNYINVWAYCQLQGHGKQFVFFNKDENNFGNGVGEYQLTDASDISRIWDITDIYNPTYILNNSDAINLKFALGVHKIFIAIDNNDFYTPEKPEVIRLDNQNLHKDVFYHTGSFQDLDMLIITPTFLHNKAEELAGMHRAIGQNTFVADLDKIYNEFGTGSQDIAAIRNFIRYIYNNASSPQNRLKYVLMFGDASIDYKGLLSEYEISNGQRTSIVPIYEELNPFSLTDGSFCSDDYFVLMDNNEGYMDGLEYPDIAIGRMLVRNEQDANVLIDKYRHYFSQVSMKPWRTYVTLWSDDWDKQGDNFIVNVENQVADGIKQYHPEINIDKIYMDAYVQVQTPGGARYPQAKRDLLNRFEKGSLLIGYIGHGNELVLTHERMLELNDVLRMRNYDRLPIFTTLTCEFGRFDNPRAETTAEHMLWNDKGGALALVTTVREIWVNSADTMNILFYRYVFGTYPGLSGTIEYNPAEALRLAKVAYGAETKFLVTYLGDPGFDLAIPKPKIVMTKINGKPTDTIRALQKVKIEGEIRDANNSLLNNYNGKVYPVIFDKYQEKQTLNNDGEGNIINFQKLGRTIFRGNAEIVNGKFSFEFIVPRDINIAYGSGRISFYGENGSLEKMGYNESITVGGIDPNAGEDNTPPQIEAYMNDTNFVNGGITDTNPYLLLQLFDDNGINTVGGVGHDITAVLDDNISDVYILNDFYEAAPNTYKSGKVKYRLVDLEPGWHTLTIKAWDVYNNSSTTQIRFQVVSNEELKLEKVLNYPNPFVNYTEFWFTHNHPFEDLDVMVQVYTISGKLVWQHRQTVLTTGFLSRDIIWDGRDNFGNKLAKGVYVYKLTVRTSTGKTAKKIEKLVIL